MSEHVKGLGGWLILVGINLVLSPILLATNLSEHFFAIFAGGVWEEITTAGSAAYHPLLGPMLLMDLIFGLGVVFASIYLAYLFFTKDYLFPQYYIGLIVDNDRI